MSETETTSRKRMTIDPDRNFRPAPRIAPDIEQRFQAIRATARRFLTGQVTDSERFSLSPRQYRQYGRLLPLHVALRNEIGYRRVTELGQRFRRHSKGAERECWIETKLELRRTRRRSWRFV